MTRPYPQVHPHVLVRGDAAAGGGGSSSGVGFPFKGAMVRLSANEVITTSSTTNIPWDVEVYNEGAWWVIGAPTKLTVPAGVTKVRLSVGLHWVTSFTADRVLVRLVKNGGDTGIVLPAADWVITGSVGRTFVSPPLDAVEGDDWEVEVWHSFGSNATIEAVNGAGNYQTYFGIEAIETVAPSVTPRGALATLTADITGQDVTTITAVPFDSELRDTDSIHDNVTNPSRMTVPVGATHVRLSGQIGVGAITSSLFVQAQVYKNGAIFDPAIVSKAEVSDVSQYVQVHVPILEVSPGDYFELMVRVETDTSVTLLDVGSYFEMEIVAPVLVARASHRGAVVTMAASRTGQNYSAGANVTWDSEVYDTDNIHDLVTNTSRLTVPPGVSKVRLDGGIGFSLVFAGGVAILKFQHNGTFLSPGPELRLEMANTDPSLCISSFVIRVEPGDYLELNLLQTDNNVTLRASKCYFSMEIIE